MSALGTDTQVRPYTWKKPLAIAREIAEALEAAHENGIIHLDLEPANIALNKEGNVKVLDLGWRRQSWAT